MGLSGNFPAPLLRVFLEFSIGTNYLPWLHIQLDNDGTEDGEMWHTKGKNWESTSCDTNALPWAANWLGLFAWWVCNTFTHVSFNGAMFQERMQYLVMCGISTRVEALAFNVWRDQIRNMVLQQISNRGTATTATKLSYLDPSKNCPVWRRTSQIEGGHHHTWACIVENGDGSGQQPREWDSSQEERKTWWIKWSVAFPRHLLWRYAVIRHVLPYLLISAVDEYSETMMMMTVKAVTGNKRE